MLSMISDGRASGAAEESDSSSTTYPLPATKRARCGSNVSTKFKGVVPQQNGHWGAQIYANHQRIWLGTFKSEKDAAMAYDSAAMKLRSGDSQKNFPWNGITFEEPNFQNLYSAEVVLNMIKNGSYKSKFKEFLRERSHIVETDNGFNLARVQSRGELLCKQLFQKELTPSDVGKLNRLVIPKKFALKHFPSTNSETAEDNAEGGTMEDVQLSFYDKKMRSWKFRYCYWKSSQSFVFTRGWNRFVEENHLKAKDTLTFYSCCQFKAAAKDSHSYLIDFNRSEHSSCSVEQADQTVGLQLELKLEVTGQIDHNMQMTLEEERELKRPELIHDNGRTGFRLFGVNIN